VAHGGRVSVTSPPRGRAPRKARQDVCKQHLPLLSEGSSCFSRQKALRPCCTNSARAVYRLYGAEYSFPRGSFPM